MTYKNIEINRDNMTYTIEEGTYNIKDIKKMVLCLEQASFKGKTKPFLHKVIPGTSFFSAMEPKLYVGIQINDDLAIYISDVPVLYNSDLYLKDVEEANRIIKALSK